MEEEKKILFIVTILHFYPDRQMHSVLISMNSVESSSQRRNLARHREKERQRKAYVIIRLTYIIFEVEPTDLYTLKITLCSH